MTWAEFKQAVERQGVKDDTEVDYIDTGSGEVAVSFDHEFPNACSICD